MSVPLELFPTSLPAFQRMFPDEGACAAYLKGVRWSDGFVCPHCGWRGEAYSITTRPTVLQCRTCRRQVSLTSGTVMERSHTALCVWFWGAYLVSSHTPGMSALQFQRQLGLGRYETAFQMLHKLRAGMVRPNRDRIGGQWPVEIDETLVGGRTRGEGRGVHHKAIVVGAVEVRRGKAKQAHELGAARPHRRGTYAGRLRLRISPDRGKVALEKFVTENVAPGSHVTTDGCHGYDNLTKLGYRHEQVVMEGDPEKADAWLPMIHIAFSNLKTWLRGTHHGVSQQHLQAYLNEFTFRFNRRFWPFNAFKSLLGIGVTVKAPTYKGLYSGKWVHPNQAGLP